MGLLEDLNVCGRLLKKAQWGSPSLERHRIREPPAQDEEGSLQAWQTNGLEGAWDLERASG